LAYGVDLSRLAQQSRGFSGADLANLVNEAALLAVRSGATLVSQECFEAAMERTRRARALSASGFSPVFTPT
jgi:cell division protease FtsH